MAISKDIAGVQNFMIGFLLLHGSIFLGVGYAISYFNPGFSLMHSGIGVLVYCVFLGVAFPKLFLGALAGVFFSLALGYLWGDFLIDAFYFGVIDRTVWHDAYATLIVFYLYLYGEIAFSYIVQKRQKVQTKN